MRVAKKMRMVTLKELVDEIKKHSDQYDVWIQGHGDGSFSLVIEDKYFMIQGGDK